MAGPTDMDELNDITFESGVDGSNTVASPSFSTWNGMSGKQSNYTAKDTLTRWNNDVNGDDVGMTSTAGTASGTITYSFGAGVTASQMTAFTNTLALWSDEANLTFAPAASGATGDVVFTVNSGNGTSNGGATFSAYDTVGSKNISYYVTPDNTNASPDTITFDTSGGYGQIGDFSTMAGYGVGALTHEVGHMIGLGHAGPYNDGAAGSDPDTSQYNAFDSRQWSVMSYIDPGDTKATYYKNYTVTGTNWSTTSGYNAAPETPMIDDILAAQRLYGAPTTTALSGGQTFGFNCNVAGGANSFFNFAVNTNPVITLYDQGTNNTLDCSGFNTACTINLNPGTFSTASAGTLTNNIGIAYNTQIDNAVGGTDTNSFTVNADNDNINGGTGSTNNSATFSGNKADYTINPTGNGSGTVVNKTTGITDTLTNIQTLNFADQSVALMCFCTGSRIRTARGDVAVEDLVVGDLATTASGALRPIEWIGSRAFDGTSRPVSFESRPIRVMAGAFGAGLPERDLWLSPGHPVLVGADEDGTGGYLVPIMCLVNGTTIERVDIETVTYWHVELDAHDVLLAEGLPVESYLDLGDRSFFTGGAAHVLANPDFVVPGLAGRCRPVAIDGPVVEAERRRLDMAFALRLDAACAWPVESAALGL